MHKIKELSLGDVLFTEGDHLSEIYFIIDGTIEILTTVTGNAKKRISLFNKGIFLGCEAYTNKKHHYYTAIVYSETIKLLCISLPSYNQSLISDPDFYHKILKNNAVFFSKTMVFIKNNYHSNAGRIVLELLSEYIDISKKTNQIQEFQGKEFLKWAYIRAGLSKEKLNEVLKDFLKKEIIIPSGSGLDFYFLKNKS